MTSATHPAEAGFLREIIANQQSDTDRLIFADWLEENGQPDRGEFIRVQCRIAALEQGCLCGGCVRRRGGGQHHNGLCAVDREQEQLPDGRSRQAFLRRRERELLEKYYFDWIKQVHPDGFKSVFRRGTVAEITCTLADWCGAECVCSAQRRGPPCDCCHGTGRVNAHGPALVWAAPLERVTLAEWDGENCRHCSAGCVPTDHDDNTCEVCHGLYNSAAALDWARAQPALCS